MGKFKENDFVVDRFGTKGRIVHAKYSCCGNSKYRVLLENGHVVDRQEHDLQLMREEK